MGAPRPPFPPRAPPSPAPASGHLLVDEVAPLGRGAEGLEVLEEGGAAVGGRQGRQPPLQPQRPVGAVQQRPHQRHQPRAALPGGGRWGRGLRAPRGRLATGGGQRPGQRRLQLGEHVAGFLSAHGHGGLQQRVQPHVGLGVQLRAQGECGCRPRRPGLPAATPPRAPRPHLRVLQQDVAQHEVQTNLRHLPELRRAVGQVRPGSQAVQQVAHPFKELPRRPSVTRGG